ncbi:MAG: hypothetical protein KC549_00450, partial [Myxococcales bacterium]|nr:hypothetical protein [Myxococcales bacterium]
MRTFVNDNPMQTYETLDWDAQSGQLLAFHTRLTATDEVVQFRQYGYKARNPGQGKVESEARDVDLGDGLVDGRTTYRYEAMMGVLESRSFQLVDAQGNLQGRPTTFTWSHVFLPGFHQVESLSVDGEVRETYRHQEGTVEVTAGCEVTRFAGRIAEIQRPGGLFGFTPEAGGVPQLGGASADFAPSGRRLRVTGCDGQVSYQAVFDEVGNL